jgi:hypothetical protein
MKKLPDLTPQNLVRGMFFTCLFLLPFINILHISTFLLIALAAICIINKNTYILNFSSLTKQPVFWLFSAYYLLQIVAFILIPEKANRSAIDQKASLLIMPALFFVLLNTYNKLWDFGKTAFIAGNLAACVICLGLAAKRYFITGNEYEFFYHKLSHGIGQGAIYFTLYLLVALFFTVSPAITYWQNSQQSRFYIYSGIALFQYCIILLLSSKMLVVAGSILISSLIFKYAEINFKRKLVFFSVIVFLATVVFSTNNPVSQRYKAVNLNIFSSSLTQTDFKDFPFDGLNFRLLLLRMGSEILRENNSFITGNGGKHYHTLLNEKIIKYDLYTGNGKNDSGYLNYNLHNQYMESFVQSGLAGLLFVLLFLTTTFYYAHKNQNEILKFIVILFGLVFLTESILETQAGILLVTIIISGEWIASQQKKQSRQTA